MAWRDSRAHRKRMFLFLSCICLGVAALVALRAFGDSVRGGIIEQSRALLGGDLLVKSRQPIPDKLTKSLQKNSVSDTKEWRFASMAKFPNSEDNSRLIQLRGIEDAFPLYGNIDTIPEDASAKFRTIENSALIDESLILQFGIKVGDPIVLGKHTFKVAGYIKSLPGESFIVSELSPRVLINFTDIPKTGLIGFGSRVKYRHYFKLPENTDKKALKNKMDDAQVDYGVRYETTEDRQEAIDKTLSNLFHFLNLVAFIALLLGGTGIGSAIRVHINSKLKNAAILRCLGASRSQALTIYFIQALIMGIVGGLLGSLFGLLLQEFIPVLISSFLPITVETSFSISALLLGTVTGTIITVLFALTPLLKLNQLSAADSLKSELNINSVKTVWEIPIQLFLASLIVIFSILSASTFKIGLYMGLGMLGALCCLALFAFIMIKIVKKTVSETLPFIWKQGLKNLFRPQNQSLTLICSLGTGTFLICLLYLAQENMLYQVRKTENGNNPNLILFDIQTDQVAGVKSILKEKNLSAIDVIPIVGMQLKSMKGKPVEFWLSENKKVKRKQRIPSWTLTRTYRSTYRDKLLDSEKLLEGNFIPKYDEDFSNSKNPVPVTVEEGIMQKMKLKVGDTMTFDLGGIELPCVISGKRSVEWMQMRPNFFVLFPDGVLNDAPQMIVSITRTPDTKTAVELQKSITKSYSNISVLDLSLVVATVSNMLNKASLAVKVMAGFSIITGLIILISSLHLSQSQRLRENTLLKVLGASQKQVRSILFSEFTFLAILSANAGLALAYTANFMLSKFVFQNYMPFDWQLVIYTNVILSTLTIVIGLLVSRKTYTKTSLDLLRSEA